MDEEQKESPEELMPGKEEAIKEKTKKTITPEDAMHEKEGEIEDKVAGATTSATMSAFEAEQPRIENLKYNEKTTEEEPQEDAKKKIALFLVGIVLLLIIFAFVNIPKNVSGQNQKSEIRWNETGNIVIIMNLSSGSEGEIISGEVIECAIALSQGFSTKGKTIYNFGLEGKNGESCTTYNFTTTTFQECMKEIKNLDAPTFFISYSTKKNETRYDGKTIYVSGSGNYLQKCSADSFSK